MKFKVKEKLFAIGNDFNLKDEDGKRTLFFDGHALSFPKTTIIIDSGTKECVGKIVEEVFAIKDKYRLLIDDKVHARVIKNWTLLNKEFVLRVEGETDTLIRGNYGLHSYNFKRAGKEIASVSKDFFGFSDGYSITIHEEKDVLPVITSVIAIDATLYASKNSKGYVKAS